MILRLLYRNLRQWVYECRMWYVNPPLCEQRRKAWWS